MNCAVNVLQLAGVVFELGGLAWVAYVLWSTWHRVAPGRSFWRATWDSVRGRRREAQPDVGPDAAKFPRFEVVATARVSGDWAPVERIAKLEEEVSRLEHALGLHSQKTERDVVALRSDLTAVQEELARLREDWAKQSAKVEIDDVIRAVPGFLATAVGLLLQFAAGVMVFYI